MSIVLITGANKGLGREAASRLIADGHDVWLAARDKRRGSEAADLLGAGQSYSISIGNRARATM